MGKITPNNYDAALKAAVVFEKSNAVKEGTLTDRLPKEINKADGKNHFHVLLIKKRHDSANERYIVSGNVQTFAKGVAFDKFKKNFKTMGISSVIIIHDPNNDPAEETDNGSSIPLHEKSAAERKIEQEEKDEMNKRIAARKAEAAKNVQGTTDPGKGINADKLEFEGVEINEANIDQFIKDNKINVKEAKTPEGKLAIVKNWIASKNK